MGRIKDRFVDNMAEELYYNDIELTTDIEYEMRLSNFLDNGGEELGYTREDHPELSDFEDVLINEIPLEKYKELISEE